MVREFEETPSDNLILIFDPEIPPDLKDSSGSVLFEYGLSLVATICWEWCRQTGDYFLLGIPGRTPAVLSGVTGRQLAQHLLACLALQQPSTSHSAEFLAEMLTIPLPPAPVLVVGLSPEPLGKTLCKALRRPVAWLDVAAPEVSDFYERADGHERS
jgi:uncharacterized protein (DUF58 family)